MQGVIVWSHPGRERALVWCEDQGRLACLAGRRTLPEGASWPRPGDVVRVELIDGFDLRHVTRARPVRPGARWDLPAALAAAAEPRQIAAELQDTIPMRRRA